MTSVIKTNAKRNKDWLCWDNYSRQIYSFFIFLFVLFSLVGQVHNSVNDILVVFVIMTFVIVKKNEYLLLMYLFAMFWDNVLVFQSIGVSAGLVIDLIVFGRLVLLERKKIKVRLVPLAFIFTLAIFACITLVSSGSATGFSIFLEAFLVLSFATQIDNKKELWQGVFLTILLSVALSMCYGIINGRSLNRFIVGNYSHVNQYASTTSTARSGVYAVCVMVYPIYYEKRSVIRSCLLGILLMVTVSTVSITAMIALAIFGCIAFITFNGEKNIVNSVGKRIAILIALIALLALSWDFLMTNSYTAAIFSRIETTISKFGAGDFSYATSGRDGLFKQYFDYFTELPIFNKIFGTGLLSARYAIGSSNYSHFTYLDILICYGVMGTVLYLAMFVGSIWRRRKTKHFIPILIVKVLVFWVGCSTSLLTNPDWFILFLL